MSDGSSPGPEDHRTPGQRRVALVVGAVLVVAGILTFVLTEWTFGWDVVTAVVTVVGVGFLRFGWPRRRRGQSS